MSRKVAIVTGSNKGIGFAIVKGLCQKWDGDVYLTARDETRGKNAVIALNKLGLNPIFHQLDVTDEDSIKKLRDHIQEKYGRLDILINNAAIAFPRYSPEPFAHQAEQTILVNYKSQVTVCDLLFPLLKPGSRVINLSSSEGHLFKIPSEEIRRRFADDELTVPQLTQMVEEFLESARNGTHVQDGWGSSAYVVSKVALTALTMIHNREYGPKGMYINAVHPGFVDTDMSMHKGPLTIEEGAKAPLHLALTDEEYQGVYMWFDCRLFDWNSKL